ncbi:MAG: hypothetical protein ACOC4G_08990 [Bacillota bacterium]
MDKSNSSEDINPNNKDMYVKSEREKGVAPPDYMPAIFGWMAQEEQTEQAREIVDFLEEINQKESDSK